MEATPADDAEDDTTETGAQIRRRADQLPNVSNFRQCAPSTCGFDPDHGVRYFSAIEVVEHLHRAIADNIVDRLGFELGCELPPRTAVTR